MQALQSGDDPVLEHHADSLALKAAEAARASALGWAPFDEGDLSGCGHRDATAALVARLATGHLERARAVAGSAAARAEVAFEVRATQRETCAHAHAGHCISEQQFDITADARRLDALHAADAPADAPPAGGASAAEVLAVRVRSNGNVVVKAWSAEQVSKMAAHAHPSTGELPRRRASAAADSAGCLQRPRWVLFVT